MGSCKDCKWWESDRHEWMGCRPCMAESGAEDARFFVGGGDNNDGLYTAPDFGCVHFEPANPAQPNENPTP